MGDPLPPDHPALNPDHTRRSKPRRPVEMKPEDLETTEEEA